MLLRAYPVSIRGDRLELCGLDGTRRLQRALATTAGSTEGIVVLDDMAQNATSVIRCRQLRTILPDRMARELNDAANLAVLEVTSGPLVVSTADITALGAAFALTVAEIAILRHIGDGLSLAEIADLRGVEVETVRNQCKQLLSKTRSRRQSDLVKLVVGLCGRDAPASAMTSQQSIAAE
jgi:DNA-binding CsgD family transcriptional regulator